MDPTTAAADATRHPGTDTDFVEFCVARRPRLLKVAYLLSGDVHTAEDIVQNSLAKLYLAWSHVNDPDAYVRRTVANETTSIWRRAFRRHETSTDTLPDVVEPWPGDDFTVSDGEVWSLIQGLPTKARAVVVLRYYEDCSEAETAALLGISRGTVKSQTSRALSLLRDRLPAHLGKDL